MSLCYILVFLTICQTFVFFFPFIFLLGWSPPFFSFFLLFIYFLVVFVIHWHESAMDIHVFPIPIPPPTSLSTWRGWDVSREHHRNMYTIKGETDHQPRLDAWDKCSDLVHWEDPFIFISWRLITLQYCSSFCHTLTWISHGFTCISHPNLPSHFPLHPIPLGLLSAPGLSTCLMHPTWAGDLFHPR